MNILLWILQIILALHTTMGAVWKFSNSEEAVDSLAAIPHGVWMSLSVVELICAICFIIPAIYKPLGKLASFAAIVIAAEMLLFIIVQLLSDQGSFGQIIYWLVVAAICAFIAYGRFVLIPFKK